MHKNNSIQFKLCLGLMIGIFILLCYRYISGLEKSPPRARRKDYIRPVNLMSFDDLDFTTSLDRCNVTTLVDLASFYGYISTIDAPCSNPIQVGGYIMVETERMDIIAYLDGDRIVCQEERYKFQNNNCTVLSFGINNEWSFSDYIDKNFGCKVYCFDPTMRKNSYDRTNNTRFENIGLGSYSHIQTGVGQVERYEDILHRLNLTSKIIDYLKIDIERSEGDFFDDIFSTSPNLFQYIKQIGMEIHPGNEPKVIDQFMITLWRSFQLLHCIGFRLTSSKSINNIYAKYPWKGTVQSKYYDLVWVNNKYKSYNNMYK